MLSEANADDGFVFTSKAKKIISFQSFLNASTELSAQFKNLSNRKKSQWIDNLVNKLNAFMQTQKTAIYPGCRE